MFDPQGYIANRPIRPDQWKTVIPDMPAGLIVTSNSVPPGFFIAQHFLAPEICDNIVRECETKEGERHTIADSDLANKPRESASRSSEFIDTRTMNFDAVKLVRHIFANVVGPQFGAKIDRFELPEILRYREGGEYQPHADADSWSAEEQTWKRVVDRDISILLYLNEGYEGGEIDFPNFGLKLQPQRGLLMAFPSDGRYLHAARPVTSGIRYALVSWATVSGSPRVNAAPREHSIAV